MKDTTIVLSHSNSNFLQTICDDTTNQISRWFSHNGFYLNKAKTHYLRFHQKNIQFNLDNIKCHIHNSSISRTPSANFLGLVVDDRLNWHLHCEKIVGKLSKTCCLLRIIRHLFSLDHLLMIYYGQVVSYLRYGICFWGSSAQDNFIAQKRIIRAMLNIPQ